MPQLRVASGKPLPVAVWRKNVGELPSNGLVIVTSWKFAFPAPPPLPVLGAGNRVKSAAGLHCDGGAIARSAPGLLAAL